MAKFLLPFFEDSCYNPGGDHGLAVSQQIEGLVGVPGLVAVLALTAIAFLTYLSAETIEVIRKALNPVKYLTSKIKFTVTNTQQKDGESSGDLEPQYPVDMASGVIDSTELPHEDEHSVVVELPTTGEGTATKPEKVPSVKPDGGAAGLTVEVGKEDAKADGKTLSVKELSTPINPREPFLNYKFPTLDLLKKYDNAGKPEVDMEEIRANNQRIVEVLNSFGVAIKEIKATVGPTITLYEITPAQGVRINKIRNLPKVYSSHESRI